MDIDILSVVNESFSTYAAMTILDRALIDARDGLKPAARQCMYAQLLEKITYKKPFKKSVKSVSAAMDHFYVHGDAACYDLLVRMAKDYNMRYKLEDFDGQYGTISNGKASAARYTEMRLGELGCLLYDGVDKHCIDKWFDNYDNTEQFPSVVPSLGYYNICNGSLGIATALACSIPQFNLTEVNEAMIKLLWNREISFDEIYCAPDFCTGSTILNASRVKEILKTGQGGSIRLRSTADYNADDNSITFTEIPYGVYINTILEQLQNLINNGEIIGIVKVNDNSTTKSKLKITLEKNINPNKIIKQLYKLTSLENNYTINMVMLDHGTYPKVFGWRDALLAHIDHEIDCKTRMYEYDKNKMLARINVIDGLLVAIANIDEVVALIKSAADKNDAKVKLINRFEFNEPQADAILKMTLSRLINLEIQSFKDEREKLIASIEKIDEILNDTNLLYAEIEAGMRAVIKKYGDSRRTKLMDLDFKGEDEDAEPIEKKELLIHYTNLGNLYTSESTTLMRTRRGTKGTKVKLASNETIVKTLRDDNFSALLVFSNKGQMYRINTDDLPLGTKINIAQLFEFSNGEKPTALTTIKRRPSEKYFVFITKKGMIKKTESSEYQLKRGKSLKAINLKDNDEVVNVLFINDEDITIVSNSGNLVRINMKDVTPIGRAAAGVKGIKLNEDEYVLDAQKINFEAKNVIVISKNGVIKKMPLSDFPVTSRGIKGKKISDVKKDDSIVKHLIIDKDYDIIIIVNKKVVKINTSDLRELSRSAIGVKGVELKENEYVVDLILEEQE